MRSDIVKTGNSMTEMLPSLGRIPLHGIAARSSHRFFGNGGVLTVQDVTDSQWAISLFSINRPDAFIGVSL